MLIKKENTWRYFNEKGLQVRPEVIDEINRQLCAGLELISAKALETGVKRLGLADISLTRQRDIGKTPGSAEEGGNIPKTEENPSKIEGPCSRCVGVHDRVMRMARDIEAQINEGAVTIYKEQLQNYKG